MCLSEQTWQYRKRRKLEIRSISSYSCRMTSIILYSAQYYRQHCALQAFELFRTLYMHSPDDKYPTRIIYPVGPTSEFRATAGPNEPVDTYAGFFTGLNQLYGSKCILKHQYLQMFGLKLNKCVSFSPT